MNIYIYIYIQNITKTANTVRLHSVSARSAAFSGPSSRPLGFSVGLEVAARASSSLALSKWPHEPPLARLFRIVRNSRSGRLRASLPRPLGFAWAFEIGDRTCWASLGRSHWPLEPARSTPQSP